MELWQLGVLAVPALVVIVSIVMIIRILWRGRASVRARRVVPRDQIATGGAVPPADRPQYPFGWQFTPARVLLDDHHGRYGDDQDDDGEYDDEDIDPDAAWRQSA